MSEWESIYQYAALLRFMHFLFKITVTYYLRLFYSVKRWRLASGSPSLPPSGAIMANDDGIEVRLLDTEFIPQVHINT